MELPFTTTEFLDVFRDYNTTIFPAQLLFYAIATIATFMAVKSTSKSGKLISLILAFFWLWMGIIYHIIFFAPINQMAYFFGLIFILQGALFLYLGFFGSRLSIEFKKDIYGYTGLFFILYSLLIYPLLGILGGHSYPYSPTFGLPCPTTIFTFGLILFIQNKVPLILLVIPFLWSILGLSAAINFGMVEDWFLIIAGLISLILIISRNKNFNRNKELATASNA